MTEAFEPLQSSALAQRTGSTVHGQPVWKIRSTDSRSSGITEFAFAPGIGSATTALRARIHGETLDVFPVRDLAAYERAAAGDPNLSFKTFNVPLFPMTNRLLPDPVPGTELKPVHLGESFTATVEGTKVRMEFNNQGAESGAIPHHLHGLLYDQPTTDIGIRTGVSLTTRSTFRDFFHGRWIGDAEVAIDQGLAEDGTFRYAIEARNVGHSPMPVGFGSHCYFRMPSRDPSAIKLIIPSRRTAVIDNLDNVLPTGKFTELRGTDGPLNFNPAAAGTIAGKFLDNYFVLEAGATVELIDSRKKVKFRLRPESPNIVGVQVYYPNRGDVIAIELVTHLPDPRAERWEAEPTGMQTLTPGESARYAYAIEVLPLESSPPSPPSGEAR